MFPFLTYAFVSLSRVALLNTMVIIRDNSESNDCEGRQGNNGGVNGDVARGADGDAVLARPEITHADTS